MAYVRLPRMCFSGEAAHTPSLLQTRGPCLSPCLTPVCGSVPGIALRMKMSELSNPKEDFQDPGNPQGQVEAQLLGSEAGKAASPLASSPSVSSSTPVEVLPQEALKEMMANLVKFLFFKYCTKKLTFKTKVLNTILMGNQDHFPVVFCKATSCLAAGLRHGGEGDGPQGARLHLGPHPGPYLRCDAEQWAEHAQGWTLGAGPQPDHLKWRLYP